MSTRDGGQMALEFGADGGAGGARGPRGDGAAALLAPCPVLPPPSNANEAERRDILRAWAVAEVVPAFGLKLGRDGRVCQWSADAAAAVFDAVGMATTAWGGSGAVPSSGVCAGCGGACAPRLRDVLAGRGPCDACGHAAQAAALCSVPSEVVAEFAAAGLVVVEAARIAGRCGSGTRTYAAVVLAHELCGVTLEPMMTTHVRAAVLAGRSPCPVCAGLVVVPDVNDLATTEPELAAWLLDSADAVRLTRGSETVALWRCVDCGDTVSVSPHRLTDKGNLPRCHTHTKHGFRTYLPALSYCFSRLTPNGSTVLMFGIANVSKRIEGHSARGWTSVCVDSSPEGFVSREMEAAAKVALLSLNARPTSTADAVERFGITKREAEGATEAYVLGSVSVKVGKSRARRLDIRKDEDWSLLCDLGDAIRYGNDEAALDARRELYLEHLSNEAKHSATD